MSTWKFIGNILYGLSILGANNLLVITRTQLGADNYFVLGLLDKHSNNLPDYWKFFIRLAMAVLGLLYGIFFIGSQWLFESNDGSIGMYVLVGLSFVLGLMKTFEVLSKPVEQVSVISLGIHRFFYLIPERLAKNPQELKKLNFIIDLLLWSGIAIGLWMLDFVMPAAYFLFGVFGLILISFVRAATIAEQGFRYKKEFEQDTFAKNIRDRIHGRTHGIPNPKDEKTRREDAKKRREAKRKRKTVDY